MYSYIKQFIFLLLAILIISCQDPLGFCNLMDGNSSCYQEPETVLVNEEEFQNSIDKTFLNIYVQGSNNIAGFYYNLDNTFWIDTTTTINPTTMIGNIHLSNLSEGSHNILIKSYYPEGDFDLSPIDKDFITDAIIVDFAIEECPSLSLNSNTISYKFLSDSFINGQRTHLYSSDVSYKWIFTNGDETNSLLSDKVHSTCYEFNQESDSLHYDVTLIINLDFTSDSFTKPNYVIIPPISENSSIGF